MQEPVALQAESPDSENRPAAPAAGSMPPALFGDIPGWIWAVFLSAWALFFGLFLLFFATSRSATFSIVIASLFGVVAFGLPMAMAAQSRGGPRSTPTVIHTHTGTLTPREAAAQIALIPTAVVIGLAAFILLALPG